LHPALFQQPPPLSHSGVDGDLRGNDTNTVLLRLKCNVRAELAG
jgi:hypothetical protein